jgi:hypothetical protein
MCIFRRNKKPKRLSTEDFNAIYQLIRDSTTHPEVKPRTGQTKGQHEYKEK